MPIGIDTFFSFNPFGLFHVSISTSTGSLNFAIVSIDLIIELILSLFRASLLIKFSLSFLDLAIFISFVFSTKILFWFFLIS